jgi:hypothetical protein
MTRRTLIEQILRQVYGGMPSDDATITPNLVNVYVNQGIGLAVKMNMKENVQIDGISYVNNSFYTTYKGLEVAEDERFLYKIELPQLPLGIGTSAGISTLKFKSEDNEVSLPCIPMSASQTTFHQTMRPIPNKILFYSQGSSLYVISTLPLYDYTATVSMVSGGDSTNLDSELNVPDDYIPTVIAYTMEQLVKQRAMPQDLSNDGIDQK